jgi:hypothetical protein
MQSPLRAPNQQQFPKKSKLEDILSKENPSDLLTHYE